MKRLKIFLPIFITGILLDQLVKYWAVMTLKGKAPVVLWGGLVKLVFATNKGAWGSAGANLSEPLRSVLLIVIPLILLIGIIVFFILKPKDVSRHDLVAYSFIASGGIGNVIDRILYNEVVDMFWFGLDQYRFLQTNVFNIADVWVMLGFFIIVFDQLKRLRHKH